MNSMFYYRGLALWCLRHFQQYFSYIVAVSFVGGGNRSTLFNYSKYCENHILNLEIRINISTIGCCFNELAQ